MKQSLRFGSWVFQDIQLYTPMCDIGDELTLSFSGGIQAIKKVSINREGNIFLREMGTISFSGLTFNEAKEKIKNIAEASLVGTEIEISLSRLRTIQVFILGNAKKPGSYNLKFNSKLTNAIFASGGLSSESSRTNIKLIRLNKNGQFFVFYSLKFIKCFMVNIV